MAHKPVKYQIRVIEMQMHASACAEQARNTRDRAAKPSNASAAGFLNSMTIAQQRNAAELYRRARTLQGLPELL